MNKFENLVSPKTFAVFLALFILSGLAPAKAVAIPPPNQGDGTSRSDVAGSVKMPSETPPSGETSVPNPNEPPKEGSIERPENDINGDGEYTDPEFLPPRNPNKPPKEGSIFERPEKDINGDGEVLDEDWRGPLETY